MFCKKTGYLLLLLLSGFVTESLAQAKGVSKVRPGQQMPDFKLTHLLDSSKVYHLSDYWRKGPLLIMNMDMRCSYCLENIPELDNYRRRFPQLQVLVNVDQPVDTMRALFNRRRELANYEVNIPVICEEPGITKITGAEQRLSFIWIEQGGKFKFVTDNKTFNDSCIQLFATGKSFKPEPIEKELGTNPVKPLLLDGYAGKSNIMLGYSVLTPYIDGLAWIQGIVKDSGRSIALAYNTSIKEMFQDAYNDTGNDSYWFPNNRTELRVKDSTPYVSLVNKKFRKEKMYCFQMIVPTVSKDSLRHLWQQELTKYFPLRARVEKQKRMCWVLKAADTSLLVTKGGSRMRYVRDPVRHSLQLLNYPIVEINEFFTFSLLPEDPRPFVNETGIKGNIDLSFEGIVFNDPRQSIDRVMQNTGLELVQEERLVDVLVLEEANQGPGN